MDPSKKQFSACPSVLLSKLNSLLHQAAEKYNLRLGAPSAAPCGADCIIPSPFDWWDQFFGYVPMRDFTLSLPRFNLSSTAAAYALQVVQGLHL